MVSNAILIGIIVGVFFGGLGVGYAIFHSYGQPNYTMMTTQQMQQMMGNPQTMTQWHQYMMQNPQTMNQWMGDMLNDPQLRQQMYSQMMQNNQFMQGMMANQQFQNQWMGPWMMQNNATWGKMMGGPMMGNYP